MFSFKKKKRTPKLAWKGDAFLGCSRLPLNFKKLSLLCGLLYWRFLFNWKPKSLVKEDSSGKFLACTWQQRLSLGEHPRNASLDIQKAKRMPRSGRGAAGLSVFPYCRPFPKLCHDVMGQAMLAWKKEYPCLIFFHFHQLMSVTSCRDCRPWSSSPHFYCELPKCCTQTACESLRCLYPRDWTQYWSERNLCFASAIVQSSNLSRCKEDGAARLKKNKDYEL